MTEFSTIKFFRLFEEAVKKYDTYPITEQNLVIQQDAYKRLADHHEDEPVFEVFASLECSQKTNDTALRFAVEFAPTMFMLHIEGADTVAHEYQGHFKNEQTAVDQIMAALVMLSNGQISCLLTERQGTYCASEVLLIGKGSRKASVLAMNASYPWSWRKSDEEGYDTFLLRNTYIDEQVAVPKNFFLIEYTPEGKPLPKGRELTTGNYTPLTKKLEDETSTAIGLEMAGKKENESEWSLLYRSWETWVITALFGGLVYWGYMSEFIPAFIRDLPFVVIFWPLSFVVGYVSFFVLGLKGYLRQMNPNNPWARLDDVLAMYAKRGIAVLTSVLLLVTTFWPLYVLKGEKEVIDIYQVASAVDVWWIYAIPALFVFAALGAFVGARKGAFAYVTGTVAGVVALIVANFAYTNNEADTPEPYTSIALLSYVAVPILAFVLCWSALRGKKSDEPAFEYDGSAHNQVTVAPEITPPTKERLEQKAKRARIGLSLAMVGGVLCAGLLALSGYLFQQTLPDASIKYLSPDSLALYFYGVAAFVSLLSLLTLFRVISYAVFSVISTALFFAILLPLITCIKDDVNQGGDWAWIWMFVGNFGQLGAGVAAAMLGTSSEQFTSSSSVTHTVREEQAVIIEGTFASGKEFGTKKEQDQLYTLEDQLEEALEADAEAEYDGNEIGQATFTLFLYSFDADALFATIEPVLKKSPFKKLHITKRYGAATDEAAKEEHFTL